MNKEICNQTKKFIKNVYKIIKLNYDHNKDSIVKRIMYLLKKLIRLHYVSMMLRDYRLLMGLCHIRMVQTLEKCVKQNCYNIKKLNYKRLLILIMSQVKIQ